MDQLIWLIDGWLESIDNETNPTEDWKADPTVNGYPDMQYPYESGVWKARAGMNADKLRRIRTWVLNEFKTIGVQSRLDKI